jgi:hypothetical protein
VPSQLLVSVVSVTSLGVGVSVTLSHGLTSGGVGVAPTLVFPDRSTPIVVTSVTDTTVTFRNTGVASETARFRCERGWQPEVDAFSVTPMFWQGGTVGTAAPDAAPRSQTGIGWSDYEEFEVEEHGPLANLIGEASVMLAHVPSPLPTQHMLVWNGRIMRLNRDYLLEANIVVLGRCLTDGDVLVAYYNKAGV